MKTIFSLLVILLAGQAQASSYNYDCSTADGLITIRRSQDADYSVLIRSSEWVQDAADADNYVENITVKKINLAWGFDTDVTPAPKDSDIKSFAEGEAYIVKEVVDNVVFKTDLPTPPVCKEGEDPETLPYVVAGAVTQDVRTITLAVKGQPFATDAWPLSGDGDGSITRKFYCNNVYGGEQPACQVAKEGSEPGICTADINEYGFPSTCSCPDKQKWDSKVGQCK